jgi:XapX domain-containing protein
MTGDAIGLALGMVIGAGCRLFDIPSPAPPRLIGAFLLLGMTIGFIAADKLLAIVQTVTQTPAIAQMVTR